MAGAENRTQRTAGSVDAFLKAVTNDGQREDAMALREMLERLSGEPAAMWGLSIVGVGSYRYKYESGREGTMARVSYSPRAKELVLYVPSGFPRYDVLLKKLGTHRTGKSCLYVKRLGDVDQDVLEDLIAESLQFMRKRYPDDA
jgi:hypothetical protein